MHGSLFSATFELGIEDMGFHGTDLAGIIFPAVDEVLGYA
jgi:hypothetical protein